MTQQTQDKRFEFVHHDDQEAERIYAPRYSYWKSVFRTFFKSKFSIFMLVILAIIVFISFTAPLFSNFDPMSNPYINDFSRRFLKPSLEFPFGTDNTGQSMWNVVWYGTRTSILIALISTAINMILGVVIGAIWGFSKKVDAVMIEVYNIVANVPFLLVVFMIMYVLGAGFWNLIFALTCTSWLSVAFFIRTQVMLIRDREYNLVSKCLGTSTLRMVSKNILPFMTSVIMTLLSREIPSIISTEAFLSFLGIGLPVTIPSLGRLISKYTSYISQYPFLFWIPVVVLALISVAFYIVGQTFADASNPKTHM